MASLTPGVLSKLLDNVGNKTVKVAGEHRSALLQVIGIVPSLAGADDADPWKSKGFFLRVSDSVHSAYVSVTEEDTDLILSDKIQLGQFIHVTRLDSGPSVPVLRGLKPVPKRRPCVGDPKDLISSDSLPNRSRVDFSPRSLKKERGIKKVESKAKTKEKTLVKDDSKTRRLSLGNGNNIEGFEARRLSLDSSRKAWDRSPRPKNASLSKLNQASHSPHSATTVRPVRKDGYEKDLSVKYSSLSISPLKNKNALVSPKTISKPVVIRKEEDAKTKPSIDSNVIPTHLVKVPVSFKTWSDSKILWDSLPTMVHDVGKEVMCLRNAVFLSAVNALEETSAAEGVLRCMSKFAELCETSQKDPTVPLVDQFLTLYRRMDCAAAAVKILVNTKSPKSKSETELSRNKTATSWVEAAIDTNLSNFTLFRKEAKSDILAAEKSHYIVLENTPMKTETENQKSPKRSSLTSRPRVGRRSVEKKEWSKGSGLKEAVTLAEKLISVSRTWFLNYLDDSLNNGFGLRSGGGLEVAALLGQLKRVNEWLDESVEDKDERIEGLKKKLYGFLLDQVNSSALQRN